MTTDDFEQAPIHSERPRDIPLRTEKGADSPLFFGRLRETDLSPAICVERLPLKEHDADIVLYAWILLDRGDEYLCVDVAARKVAIDSYFSLPNREISPIKLRSGAEKYFHEFFREIEYYSSKPGSEVRRWIEQRGLGMFEDLLPQPIQELLGRLSGRDITLHIVSTDTWIPWELLKLFFKDGGRTIDGPFLCESFALTRSFEVGEPHSLPLKNVAFVIPQSGTGLADLENERDYLLSLHGSERSIKEVPARFSEILDEMEQGECDGWHFGGHGKFDLASPDDSSFKLNDEIPLTVGSIRGAACNCGNSRPFVFFNSCCSANHGMSLVGIAGWARVFLKIGAGAFVGTYWSVFDEHAFQSAKSLYSRLLSGVPIADAMKEVRASLSHSNDLTWLAYTVYAHPRTLVPSSRPDRV